MAEDPRVVLDLIEAFRRSKTMFVAVSLGVFDRLRQKPEDAATLAREWSADQDALERLLDSCVSLGLLRNEGSLYTNLPVADTYLARSSTKSLAGYVLYSNSVLYPMWGNLEDAVREGTHRWRQTFGLDGPLFSSFFRTPEAMREFLMGMHCFGMLSSPAVVAAFDLSRFRRLADLGGATGHLVQAACERYPGMRGVLFDLPAVIEFARQRMSSVAVADRIDLVAGDFFRDPLPGADLYALGRILHDWAEHKIHALLVRLYEALPYGGGVLLAERILDEDKTGPVPACMQSLNMLICTDGKERTLGEYRALFRDAGFAEVEGHHTSQPMDAILAIKR